MAVKISSMEVSFSSSVPNISKLKSVDFPIVALLNIPWKISVSKEHFGGIPWLGIDLYCKAKRQTPAWTCPAYFAVKLKSSTEDALSIEYQSDPYIFTQSGRCFGDKIIEWNDLLDPAKGYVKDDAIELEIKINAFEQKCQLKCYVLSYENNSTAKYELRVTNADQLIALQSPMFKMNDSPFTLTVFKNSSGYLAVYLESMLKMDDVKICMLRTTFKLLSFKGDNPIEIVKMSPMSNGGMMDSMGIISWKDLFDRQSGYVKNNRITIEVKMEANPMVNMANDDNINNNNNGSNQSLLECAICFTDLKYRNVSSTVCGHIFCSACIAKFVETRKICPSCGESIAKETVRPIYLPL